MPVFSSAFVVRNVFDLTPLADALQSAQRWSQTIDLREFADAAWLGVDIDRDSDLFVPKGDTRTRGVRINRLFLTRLNKARVALLIGVSHCVYARLEPRGLTLDDHQPFGA